MKHAVIGLLVIVGALASMTIAFAQQGKRHIYIYLMQPHEEDTAKNTGVLWGYSDEGDSKEAVRQRACSNWQSDFDMWSQGCAANPVAGCKQQVAMKKYYADSCMSEANSISCSGPGYWAIARTARPEEMLQGGHRVIGAGPAVGGATCGRKTPQAAQKAAMASCEKTRAARGLTGVKCYPLGDGQVK